jgi:hypothetical protein
MGGLLIQKIVFFAWIDTPSGLIFVERLALMIYEALILSLHVGDERLDQAYFPLAYTGLSVGGYTIRREYMYIVYTPAYYFDEEVWLGTARSSIIAGGIPTIPNNQYLLDS